MSFAVFRSKPVMASLCMMNGLYKFHAASSGKPTWSNPSSGPFCMTRVLESSCLFLSNFECMYPPFGEPSPAKNGSMPFPSCLSSVPLVMSPSTYEYNLPDHFFFNSSSDIAFVCFSESSSLLNSIKSRYL